MEYILRKNKATDLMKKYHDYILVLLLYFLPHLFMKFNCWDDVQYTTFFEEYHYNIFSFVSRQYQYWTSRVFIEAAVIFFGWLPSIVWMIADTLMIVLLYHSFSGIVKLWVKENETEYKFKVCQMLLFMSFPYALMATAGWLTTTINWTWMLALFVYAMKKLLYSISGKEKPLSLFGNILYCCAYLYATNFDVAAILMLCLMIIIGIVCYKSSSYQFSNLYWEGLVITVGNLLLFLLCPGNRIRMERDAVLHDTADMLTLSIWGKLRMGINSTFYHYASIPNAVLFTACIILLIAVFMKKNDILTRLIACIPVGIISLWTAYIFVAYTIKNRTLTYVYPDATFQVCRKAEQYLAMFSAMVMVLSIIFLLRQVIEENGLFIFLVVVLLFWGLLPEVVLGFTTTISASILRVVSFFYFALIFISCVIIGYSKMLMKPIIRYGIIVLGIAGTLMNYMQMIRHIIVYG